MDREQCRQVVIVGGGFGGLYAARSLWQAPVRVTLVDKRNFHLFQPLLYQVASGALSPGDIAAPLRDIFVEQSNVDVLLGEVIDINVDDRLLTLRDGSLRYDLLILAPGSDKQYFGQDNWQPYAPGLKTIEDAVRIRRKVLLALESAEKEENPEKRRDWLTFVVVGGGPTGVEMAGTLAELIHETLKWEYRHADLNQARILIVEAGDAILSSYPIDLQQQAMRQLKKLGIMILTRHKVRHIMEGAVTISQDGGQTQEIRSSTILWTAGVKASPLGRLLHERTGCPLDKAERVIVNADCSVPGYPNIFVIGDLAAFSHRPDGAPLPGLAAVAIQQGQFVADTIRRRLNHQPERAFHYRDKGNLAIIGRNAAIAQIGNLHISGFPAWLVWLLVHIFYLVGFENKVIVIFQWGWSYLTRKRSACLITEQA